MSNLDTQECYLLYLLLQRFYAGQMIHLEFDAWQELIRSIQADVQSMDNEKMQQGFQKLLACTNEQFDALEYDFNRLFVGPGKLLAAPYESTYLNPDRVLMQRETLAVRRFYERAGLELIEKNHEPDDHIALELEFICYLFENVLENADQMASDMLEEFLQTHLLLWVGDFCKDIQSNSEHPVCLGMAEILEGMTATIQSAE